MTTTAATRLQLPNSLEDLRRDWLPPEPDCPAVNAARSAKAVIDDAVGAATARREALEADERSAADAVVAAAGGGDITEAVAELERIHLAVLAGRHLVEALRPAATLANYQLAEAERTDPDYVAWSAHRRAEEDDYLVRVENCDDKSVVGAWLEEHKPS